MAIAKKPKRNTNEVTNEQTQKERKAENFIARASHKVLEKERQNKTPIMIRFDPKLLDKVDEASRHRGISRSSWIQYVISRAIDHGEG